MIIAGTGHRPSAIGGYKLPNPTYNKICQEIEKVLLDLKPDKVLSGMALGYDQYLANIARKLKIPFVAVVPFDGQDNNWIPSSKRTYQTLLKLASDIVVVSSGGYSAYKMQIRNQYLVDNCDILLACYNGEKSGGTANCVKYAQSVNKQIIFIDPRI